MNRPRLLITMYSEAVLTFPFDRWLVDSLKAEIPAYSRTYDPVAKAWTISGPYISTARRLMTTVFPDTEIIDESPSFAPPRSDNRPHTEYTILHLLPSAPPELVESAYRCLARLNHPDAGGDHETMQRLNEAVSTLRQRLA